jgi:hypothetical protein
VFKTFNFISEYSKDPVSAFVYTRPEPNALLYYKDDSAIRIEKSLKEEDLVCYVDKFDPAFGADSLKFDVESYK